MLYMLFRNYLRDRAFGGNCVMYFQDVLRRFEIPSSSHSLRSLYSYTRSVNTQFISFIHILVQHLTSLSSWPSDYRLGALRFLTLSVFDYVQPFTFLFFLIPL